MSKVDCWDHRACGRQPGGPRVHELGVCPASTHERANGFLQGKNGGRACMYVTGTFCSGTVEGTHKEKEKTCATCAFYREVKAEHGAGCSVYKFLHYVGDV